MKVEPSITHSQCPAFVFSSTIRQKTQSEEGRVSDTDWAWHTPTSFPESTQKETPTLPRRALAHPCLRLNQEWPAWHTAHARLCTSSPRHHTCPWPLLCSLLGAAPGLSPAVINRSHLLSPLGSRVARFLQKCSISRCKNKGCTQHRSICFPGHRTRGGK